MKTSAPEAPRELPGDLAMWKFIFAEPTVFALLFAACALTRGARPADRGDPQRW